MVGIGLRLRTLCLLAVSLWGFPATVRADDIAVLCYQSLRTALAKLAPQFERAGGGRLVVTYDTSHNLKAQVEAGMPFDVVILTFALVVALV